MLPRKTPEDLAVPTDLSLEKTTQVANTLNGLVADAFTLYVKAKNYHWHVYGPHFVEYHELFGEQADEVLASIDVLAERVRKLGKVTIRSIADITHLTSLEDSEKIGMTCTEMIKELLDDNKKIVVAMREAIETCEESGDRVTSNILQDMLDQAEKRVWFLFELTQ